MPADEEIIRQVAAEHIRVRGPHVVDWLIEQAELAEGIKDSEAAKVWRDIAVAAESILSSQSN
jgi:hypothetical protein